MNTFEHKSIALRNDDLPVLSDRQSVYAYLQGQRLKKLNVTLADQHLAYFAYMIPLAFSLTGISLGLPILIAEAAGIFMPFWLYAVGVVTLQIPGNLLLYLIDRYISTRNPLLEISGPD